MVNSSNKNKRMSFRLSTKEYSMLKAVAKSNFETTTNLVRRLLLPYIEVEHTKLKNEGRLPHRDSNVEGGNSNTIEIKNVQGGRVMVGLPRSLE